jgi:hypothetical protein
MGIGGNSGRMERLVRVYGVFLAARHGASVGSTFNLSGKFRAYVAPLLKTRRWSALERAHPARMSFLLFL